MVAVRKRVLVIDDDPVLLGTVRELLGPRGTRHESATSENAVVRALGTLRPTHIILDPANPALDGMRVIQQLATHQVDAAIVIASDLEARLTDAVQRTAVGKGLFVAGSIAKPVPAAALWNLLERADNDAAFMSRRERQVAAPETIEALRVAVERKEIHLEFQPKVSCRDGELVGFEALARWRQASGTVQPRDFIPVAEQAGLIRVLTQQLLEEGLGWLAELRGTTSVALCLNLSPVTLVDAGFPDSLDQTCRRFNISPARVVLELTETATMRNPALALEMVTRLRLHGFHAAIDDVGTGYSSLSQLARLPFSELKVDRTFVSRAGHSEEYRKIVDSFIRLGHQLGLLVIAEGVEDADALDYLVDTGCDFAQGYFIARPMAAEVAANWRPRPPLR